MIKKLLLVFFPVVALFAAVGIFLHSSPAHATFNPNNLIDDSVFTNSYTMSANQIDSWINTTYGAASCISTAAGFSAPDPTGYSPSGGFTYGGNVTAGQVIYDAAQAYGINPQVLLTTLQKEQSLVSGGSGCSTLAYTGAMGYGCPDSGTTHSYSGLDLYSINGVEVTSVNGTCVNTSAKAGFSQQVIHGAWLLMFGEQRSEGNVNWDVQKSNSPQPGDVWNNSDDPQTCYGGPMTEGTWSTCPNSSPVFYDGSDTIDGTSIQITNGATAALYWYTPHFAGNQNFDTIFTNWFGAPYANANDYSFVTSTASALHYNPGGTGTATIVLENTGLNTWYSDHNLPAGKQPTRLATAGYRSSPFITPDANSLNTQNQILMTPDVVAPGQNATFTIDISAPYRTFNWEQHFIPIIGGAFLKDVGIDFVLYDDVPSWQLSNSSADTLTPLPNQQSLATFSILNNSGSTWYSDHNLPAGKQPTRLATIGYQNSPFADTADARWLGTQNQIMMTPDSVAPGQTATFQAYFIGPISSRAVAANFHFFVIVGGVFTQDKGCNFNMSTPAANLSYSFVSTSGVPATMPKGTSVAANLTIQNTGNVVWQDENFDNGAHALRLMMSHPNYRSSSFYDAADTDWLTASQIAKTTGTVWPGQNATFSFTWLAPSQTGAYTDPFQPIVGGNFMQDMGFVFHTTVQ